MPSKQELLRKVIVLASENICTTVGLNHSGINGLSNKRKEIGMASPDFNSSRFRESITKMRTLEEAETLIDKYFDFLLEQRIEEH